MARLAPTIAACLTFAASATPSLARDVVTPTAEQTERCARGANQNIKTLCLHSYTVPGLDIPSTAETFATGRSMDRPGLFKPAGNGPFPAIVYLHACDGLTDGVTRWWVGQMVERGYVALTLDSFTSRGMGGGLCQGGTPKDVDDIGMRTRDAFEALVHLGRLPFVDSARVGAIGESHGGRVVNRLSGRAIADVLSPSGARFAAGISMYGQCYNRLRDRLWLRGDVDRPLLNLLGALDTDGDPSDCVPRLEKMKANGQPVDWQVYPGIGHAWDNPKVGSMHVTNNVAGQRSGVLMGYDATTAMQSRDRAFAFFARYLGGR